MIRKKNYRPYRIVNPTCTMHVAALNCLQDISINISKPKEIVTNCSDEAKFNVCTFGDLIEFGGKKENEKGTIYTFHQKYDFEPFLNYGSLVLGEIVVNLANNNHPLAKPFRSSVLAILEGKKNILNIINPSGLSIKAKKNQLLYVTCFEPSWDIWKPGHIEEKSLSCTWKPEVIRGEQSCNGKWTVIHNMSVNTTKMMLSSFSKLYPNPKLKDVKPLNSPLNPKTFVFGFQHETSDKKTSEIALNGYISICGKYDDEEQIRYFDIWSSNKSTKMINPNPTDRRFMVESHRKILFNPAISDSYDFNSSFSEVIVKIATPNHFGSVGDWKATCYPSKQYYLDLESLGSEIDNGIQYNKFKIWSYTVSSDEIKFLGSVAFTCDDKRREISFYLTKLHDFSVSPNKKKKDKVKERELDNLIKSCEVTFDELNFSKLSDGTTTMPTRKYYGHLLVTNDNENLPVKVNCKTECKKVEEDNASLAQAIVIVNPSEDQRVLIKCDQKIIIKFPVVDHSPIGELWVISHESYKNMFEITKSSVVANNGKYHQEVEVVGKNRSGKKGTYYAGSIKAKKADKVINISIDVETTDEKKIPVSTHFEIVSPSRHLGEKPYLDNWRHNDAIVVKHDTPFYIRNPAAMSDFKSDKWGFELKQCSIPQKAWKNPELSKISTEIDMDNIWFNTTKPLCMASCWMFRSMEQMQPHAKTILKAVADAVDFDLLQILNVTFFNNDNKHNRKIVTPIGEVSTSFSIRRTVGIYIDLKNYRTAKENVYVDNPKDGDIVLVKSNGTITIRFSCHIHKMENVGFVQFPWVQSEYSTDLIIHKGKNRINGSDEFQYDLKKAGDGYIILTKDNKSVKINVKAIE